MSFASYAHDFTRRSHRSLLDSDSDDDDLQAATAGGLDEEMADEMLHQLRSKVVVLQAALPMITAGIKKLQSVFPKSGDIAEAQSVLAMWSALLKENSSARPVNELHGLYISVLMSKRLLQLLKRISQSPSTGNSFTRAAIGLMRSKLLVV
jgi:hypothetical protein